MRLRIFPVLLVPLLLTTIAFAQTAPASNHIVVVALENQSYEDVVGSPAMPYLNSLISQGALATKYFANIHGSLSNYFMATTGELVTNDDGFQEKITIDNVVRELIAANKTWRAYAQSLPSVGYTGNDVPPYVKHHNPFAYYNEVLTSTAQAANIVPFTQFASDLAANNLANFTFIVPDNQHNGHDCPNGAATCANTDKLAAADAFLQQNLSSLLTNSVFQQDGLLVIWWDEGNLADTQFTGGHVAIVFVGPRAKVGFQSTTFYRHENFMRTLAESLALPTFPGASVYVTSMSDMMTTGAPPPTGPGTISGTVKFALDGSALSGATITYSGGTTTTDSTGKYTLANVAAATYNVSASKPGFFTQNQQVTVASSATSTANFSLATGGKIGGTVTSAANGAVISGASVQCTGGLQATNITGKTATNGTYNTNWIPIGSYACTVSATGHASKSANANVTTGNTTTLNIALN